MTVQPIDVVMLAGAAIAAVIDARTGKIPNLITFPMMAIGIGLHASIGEGWSFGVLGVASAFAVHFLLYLVGVEKAGDAKLVMGISACMGWKGMLETSAWYAILYIPIGAFMLAIQNRLPNLAATVRRPVEQATGTADGPAPEPTMLRTGPIIFGAAVMAWYTPWLQNLF